MKNYCLQHSMIFMLPSRRSSHAETIYKLLFELMVSSGALVSSVFSGLTKVLQRAACFRMNGQQDTAGIMSVEHTFFVTASAYSSLLT
jgi:hypothetical protein